MWAYKMAQDWDWEKTLGSDLTGTTQIKIVQEEMIVWVIKLSNINYIVLHPFQNIAFKWLNS